jgi:hypothetical protein
LTALRTAEELCADFSRLAELAATIARCDADHPIGRAYQAALHVLDDALRRGERHTYVPAAHRVRNAIDAVLARRDERRRQRYPDAPPDAVLFHAFWIERLSVLAIARRVGQSQPTIRERILGALDALVAELGDAARHFQPGHTAKKPAAKGKAVKRPPIRPRAQPDKELKPSSPEEVTTMVAAHLAAGGQIQRARPGRTRDHKSAAKILNTGRNKPGAVPAKKLPRNIGDLARLPGAKGHASEVWTFLHGRSFSEMRTTEEKEDRAKTHELVEHFLDLETRRRREEAGTDDRREEAETDDRREEAETDDRRDEQKLEKELMTVAGGTLSAESGRSKRRRWMLAEAWLNGPSAKREARRLAIRQRGRRQAPEVLAEVKHHRLPSKPKPEPTRLEDLQQLKIVKRGEAA